VTHSEDIYEKSAPKSPKFEGKSLDSPYLDQLFSLCGEILPLADPKEKRALRLLQNILGGKSRKFTIFQGTEA
jgi:hypothetical protein